MREDSVLSWVRTEGQVILGVCSPFGQKSLLEEAAPQVRTDGWKQLSWKVAQRCVRALSFSLGRNKMKRERRSSWGREWRLRGWAAG